MRNTPRYIGALSFPVDDNAKPPRPKPMTMRSMACGHSPYKAGEVTILRKGRFVTMCKACAAQERMDGVTHVDIRSIPCRPITRPGDVGVAFCPRTDMCCCWITGVKCEACARNNRAACLCAKDALKERPMQASDYMIVQGDRGWNVLDVLPYYREHKEVVYFHAKTRKECAKWVDKAVKRA